MDDLATHKAFIDAIAANPDDDTARLVYADWLDDRGDPRADYLRLEVEWKEFSYRRQAIETRLDELYHDLDKEWLGQMTYDLWLHDFNVQSRSATIRDIQYLSGAGLQEALILLDSGSTRILHNLPRHKIVKRLQELRTLWPISGSQFKVRFRMPLKGVQ